MSAVAWMAAPYDADHGVKSVVAFVRSDEEKLRELDDEGVLAVKVTRSIPLSELPTYAARRCG